VYPRTVIRGPSGRLPEAGTILWRGHPEVKVPTGESNLVESVSDLRGFSMLVIPMRR